MSDEQTNTPDTQGTETNKPVETPKEPISLYDKTEKIVAEDKANLKKREELIEREETLHANQRLAGTTGGHVEPTPAPVVTNDELATKMLKGEIDPLTEDGIGL